MNPKARLKIASAAKSRHLKIQSKLFTASQRSSIAHCTTRGIPSVHSSRPNVMLCCEPLPRTPQSSKKHIPIGSQWPAGRRRSVFACANPILLHPARHVASTCAHPSDGCRVVQNAAVFGLGRLASCPVARLLMGGFC